MMTTNIPTLTTERFVLRIPELKDAPLIQQLAGDKAIAKTTLAIPHPYEDGLAEAWVLGLPEQFEQRTHATFAVARKDNDALIGVMGLVMQPLNDSAELGYWIGKPHWGQGVATEAARAALAFGFNEWNLNRIYAFHMAENTGSGRVLQKIGMTYEGCLRQHVQKWGVFHDSECYGILKSEFDVAN
jgi:RimJ/RimL family protein N-acetyltransferase